ncbi:hypothetical protein O181_022021 [Austropuccinia psidii MF-1]|uniref:Uncharacterized protein n=1 Tax=Austropuccinia psidii MF-1 TaxID=1389203 RepID=A0A9Q3GWA9_9BASI|nr:hypothetical protein [Austropuccinia psidii MF-1]
MPPSHWPNPQGCICSLCSSSPLKMRLQRLPHLCPHHPLCFRTPTLSSPPLYILTLPWHPQDMPLTPPSTPLMPNPLSAAYHPYTQVLETWGTVAC